MRRSARLALLTLLTGCAAVPAPHTVSPAHDPEPVALQVEALRKEQLERLYRFDGDVAVMGDRCSQLCNHHSAICGLATRICDIAKGNPDSARARDLCELSTGTCRETSERLPTDCFCR